MAGKVLVIGVGNPLARDEGVGIRVIERLHRRRLPAGVEVVDAGTDLVGVLPRMAEARRCVLVDAVRAGGRPGEVHRLALEEVLERAGAEAPWRSAHDLSVVGALRLARETGLRLPPTVLVGVEPAEVALGEGLTPAVEAAVESAVEAVLAELNVTR